MIKRILYRLLLCTIIGGVILILASYSTPEQYRPLKK